MAAHRYWRCHVKQLTGGTATAFAEIEMRTALGGADQCTGGTPLVSHAPTSGTAASAFANDGTTTQCVVTPTADAWIGYDFGAGNEKDIIEVAYWGASGTNRSPGVWSVDWSDDGVEWTTAWRVESKTGWTTNVARVFSKPVIASDTARYWRVWYLGNVKGTAVGSWRCAEMEMYDAVGGANLCTGGTPIASGTGTTGLLLANAFDGSFAIGSYANISSGNATWIGYDFGAANDKAIVEIIHKVVGGTSDGWADAPITGDVEASNDGVNWLPVWSFADKATGLEYIHNITKPGNVPSPAVPGTHRFWGLRFNATQSGGAVYVERLIMASAPAGGNIGEATTQCCATAKINATGYYPYYSLQNSASDWSGRAANGGGEVLAYDHLRGTEVAAPVELRLTADAAAFAQMPTDFDLVYSEDGELWTTLENFTTPADWIASQTRTFAVTATESDSRGRQIMIGN
jgi:hypothetical protein